MNGDWKPIETLPKDNSMVIIVFRNKCICIAPARSYMKPSVVTEDFDSGFIPTHWMELPDPPAGDDSK